MLAEEGNEKGGHCTVLVQSADLNKHGYDTTA